MRHLSVHLGLVLLKVLLCAPDYKCVEETPLLETDPRLEETMSRSIPARPTLSCSSEKKKTEVLWLARRVHMIPKSNHDTMSRMVAEVDLD